MKRRQIALFIFGALVVTLAASAALIQPFGARGAAWASLLALLANLIAHVYVYRRVYKGVGPL